MTEADSALRDEQDRDRRRQRPFILRDQEAMTMAIDRIQATIPDITTPEFLGVLRVHGATATYVFSSTTRGEERPVSDLTDPHPAFAPYLEPTLAPLPL